MKVAIDIDGTLCEEVYHTKYPEARPFDGAVGYVKNIVIKGHKAFYYSARHEEDREVTMAWLQKWGFPVLPLILDKPLADVYVDDRSCPDLITFDALWVEKGADE